MLPECDPNLEYETLWRVKVVEHPPLEKWSSLAGECLHALRSALDHTAFALVQMNRPGEDYAEFPIIKNKFFVKGHKRRLRWDRDAERKLPASSAAP